mgnify:CR=1 FL=1
MAVKSKKHSYAYDLIEKKSVSNIFIQGAGGVLGTISTFGADIYAFRIYSELWDEIRIIYGHQPFELDEVSAIIPKLGKEIITDIALDKVLGYVPIIGVFTNAICAKTMTWRLGILFAILSSKGDILPGDDEIIKAVCLIREMYPQKDMLTFVTPKKDAVIKILLSIENNTDKKFKEKLDRAYAAFD